MGWKWRRIRRRVAWPLALAVASASVLLVSIHLWYARETNAIHRLRATGAKVDSHATGPEWFCEFFGARYESARHVFVNGTAVTGAEVADIGKLRKIAAIRIEKTPVPLSSFEPIADAPVTWLELVQCNITNEHVALMQKNADVSIMHLSGNPIDDGCIRSLRAMPNLFSINLEGTRVTNQGTRELGGIQRLTWVNLARTTVDDDGCTALAKLPKLQKLDLSFTAVTDEGVARLVSLPCLSVLDLRGTRVTAKVLPILQQAPSLAIVDLSECDVRQEDCDRAAQSKPGLQFRLSRCNAPDETTIGRGSDHDANASTPLTSRQNPGPASRPDDSEALAALLKLVASDDVVLLDITKGVALRRTLRPASRAALRGAIRASEEIVVSDPAKPAQEGPGVALAPSCAIRVFDRKAYSPSASELEVDSLPMVAQILVFEDAAGVWQKGQPDLTLRGRVWENFVLEKDNR